MAITVNVRSKHSDNRKSRTKMLPTLFQFLCIKIMRFSSIHQKITNKKKTKRKEKAKKSRTVCCFFRWFKIQKLYEYFLTILFCSLANMNEAKRVHCCHVATVVKCAGCLLLLVVFIKAKIITKTTINCSYPFLKWFVSVHFHTFFELVFYLTTDSKLIFACVFMYL